ncbi:MAG: enoyl-CoA hydratase/isomerase family protein [Alphaproteobacteria bacterium]|nr:enoyl-CoA hydratase/isomerase family protein [Alphaproteobacteria bacterium]
MSVVLVDRPAPGVTRLTMNMPEKKNPVGAVMRDALLPVLQATLADDAARAIILAGAGGTFCSGGDVSTMHRMTPAEGRRRMKGSHPLVRALYEAGKPVVAAVEGHAVGAGAGVALLCDTIVMGEGAKFGIPFFRLGLVPDFGLLFTLPRRIGFGRARQLLLQGKMIDARECDRLGIVDRLVPDAEVQSAALEVAKTYTEQPPLAFAVAKRLLDSAPASLDMALEMEALAQGLCFAHADVEEGLTAFREKRKPKF